MALMSLKCDYNTISLSVSHLYNQHTISLSQTHTNKILLLQFFECPLLLFNMAVTVNNSTTMTTRTAAITFIVYYESNFYC